MAETAEQDMPSDHRLLDEFVQEGSTVAFTTLVDRYQGILLRYVRVLLGSATATRMADDIVQETFLRLARTPPLPPGETDVDARGGRVHLSAWLHTVARNRAMEVLRSETRRQNRERTAAPTESQDSGVGARDTRSAVEEGLLHLPADQREVLVLRLLQEKSYRDIATLTGRKIGTVGWLISEGLRTLSARLAPVLDRIPVREAAEGPARVRHLREGTS